MSKYRRIKYEDRCQIYALSKRGSSQESIAEVLGVSQSAVSREMHRNRGQRGYRFKQAEAKAHARQAIRSKPRKLTALMRCKIEAKLRQMRWSPEQISGWLSEQGIRLSHECIYQMIWNDKRDGGNLWRSLGNLPSDLWEPRTMTILSLVRPLLQREIISTVDWRGCVCAFCGRCLVQGASAGLLH